MSESSELKRVVLVGFMGAGKSAVGRRTATRLGWQFVDVDAQIEAQAGKSIAQIFRTEGEPAFREIEHRITLDLLQQSEVVISTGGGWPVRDDRMGQLPDGTLSVWLVVDAATAVARGNRRPGTRPLLNDPNPMQRARQLLAERTPEYSRAELHLETHGASPAVLAGRIVHYIRGQEH